MTEVESFDISNEISFEAIGGTEINPPASGPGQRDEYENDENDGHEVVKLVGGDLMVKQLVGMVHDEFKNVSKHQIE